MDWKDNKVFATCSSDHFIYVGEVGTTQSIRKFDGHKHEVNAIKWCPEGKLLASCSDDCTAKVIFIDIFIIIIKLLTLKTVMEYGFKRSATRF